MKRFLLPGESPVVSSTAFIAEGAILAGGVAIGDEAGIWYGCVLRGDINHIRIGARSNLQDGTIVHVADDYAAEVGEAVSVGHRAIIHACQIGDETLIGMGAVVMDGAVIGPRCIVAAGALVTKHFVAPEGSLVMGAPARVVRPLSREEQQGNVALAAKYVELARRYRALREEGHDVVYRSVP
jgi:carbonic anhydrase/acetyltransferase-like protein (isoleucine patch superfamily)